MIFDLNPLWGFLPLLLYIVLMLRGKDMNVSVLLCVILGAVLNGESILGFANTIYSSLGSFCALIGFIIVLGSAWQKSSVRQRWRITLSIRWSIALSSRASALRS